MSKYDLVVFDVDGTLLDTTEGVLESARYAIDSYGLAMPSEAVLKTFIGPPIQNSFAGVYPQLTDVQIKELTRVFRDKYKSDHLLKAVPYDGIYKLCDALAAGGVKIAVATYKRQDYAVKLLKHFGFDRYTNILYGADDDNRLKKKDIIELAIRDSGVRDYSRVVMVGDSSHDALGAEQIGVDFIGVTFGFEFRTVEDVNRYQNVGVAFKPQDIINFLIYS